MFYYLFEYLEQQVSGPGFGLFQYITFRAGLAVLLSLIISMLFGNRIIRSLRKLQLGETVRDLGLAGQMEKAGTPTMGGVIIILATLVPVLLFAKVGSIYIILMIITTIWLAIIGFIDDYIKVIKKDKSGLAARFKVFGQIGIGLIVGFTMLFHSNITVRVTMEEALANDYEVVESFTITYPSVSQNVEEVEMAYVKTTLTNVPFIKGNLFEYESLLGFLGKNASKFIFIIFVPFIIFIVTAVSNGANLTDGLDGLATGVSAIIGATLGILAYVSGSTIMADYLNILYIPESGELVIFAASFVGACVGFLWFNSYPAKVFMGDTGSLSIGGIIAVFAVLIRKELLIPILCGIFVAETLSVVMQVSYFKYTKKKYGEGRRIFRMSPLHHHYQKLGMHEAKIVTRFWIVGIMLAILTIITLKMR